MDMTILLIAGAALAIIILIIGLVVSLTSDRSLVEERLGRYVEKERPVEATEGENTSQVSEWLNQRVSKSSFGENLSRELARADIKLKASEYIALMVLSAVGVGIVIYFIGGSSMFVGLGG